MKDHHWLSQLMQKKNFWKLQNPSMTSYKTYQTKNRSELHLIKTIYQNFIENITLNNETLTKLALNQKQDGHLYHVYIPTNWRAGLVQ